MTRRENDDVFILVVILADLYGMRLDVVALGLGGARRRSSRLCGVQATCKRVVSNSKDANGPRKVGRLVRTAVRGGSGPQLQVVARCC